MAAIRRSNGGESRINGGISMAGGAWHGKWHRRNGGGGSGKRRRNEHVRRQNNVKHGKWRINASACVHGALGACAYNRACGGIAHHARVSSSPLRKALAA